VKLPGIRAIIVTAGRSSRASDHVFDVRSADDRQLAVAKATGLKVMDIKRRARRKKS
jgi:hypothetical protein